MTLNFGATLFPSRSEYTKSFEFKDMSQGQGFVTFFGNVGLNDLGEEQQILTVNQQSTDKTLLSKSEERIIIEEETFHTENLDLEIAITEIISGKAHSKVFWKASSHRTTSTPYANFIKAKAKITLDRIRKGMTTEIGTAISEAYEETADDVDIEKNLNFIINCNETPLAKGDILRVKLQTIIEYAYIRKISSTSDTPEVTSTFYLDPLDTLKETTSISDSSTEADITTTIYSNTYDSKLFNITLPFKLDI